jgi:hypothetical protein
MAPVTCLADATGASQSELVVTDKNPAYRASHAYREGEASFRERSDSRQAAIKNKPTKTAAST